MARLSHEFKVLKALEEDHVEGVIRPVELLSTPEKGLVLVMHDWQHKRRCTLRKLIDTTYALHSIERHLQHNERAEGIHLNQFFMIAIGVVEVLKRLHERGFVHKDIKPDSIHLLTTLYNQEIKVQLVGLDICERQQMRHHEKQHGHKLDLEFETEEKKAKEDDDDEEEKTEGTWAYMSPEQTGRTKRLVDHRTDFYSLGNLPHWRWPRNVITFSSIHFCSP